MFKKVLILLYCLVCNVGLRHQNLNHLNRTHKKKNKNKIKYIYTQQKININKISNKVKIIKNSLISLNLFA